MSNAENDRRIDYIELTVKDIAAAKAFYDAAFGWSFTDYGPDYTSFDDGRIGGGLRRKDDFQAGGGPLVVIYVADLAAAQQRIEAAGGRIVEPVFSFPGGRRFHFADPDGNVLAAWSDQ